MTTNEIVELFKEKPYYLRMGNYNISKRLHCLSKQVKEARQLYRANYSAVDKIRTATRLPKILVLDIETAPLKAFIWKLWKENIPINSIISDWFCICWSAKWLFNSDIYSDCATPKEALNEDDSRVMISLKSLLDEADIVLTYNGNKFDIPRINSRLLLNNINPPKPFTSLDLYTHVKKKFNLSSNKLDYLATILHLPNKLYTDFNLWKACTEGNKDALDRMVEYNKYDVELLESVYLKVRPWIQGHPNLGLYLETDKPVCPNCGSHLLQDAGYYYTSTNRYKLYQCECGAFSRMRTSEIPSEKRPQILTGNTK